MHSNGFYMKANQEFCALCAGHFIGTSPDIHLSHSEQCVRAMDNGALLSSLPADQLYDSASEDPLNDMEVQVKNA